MNDIYKDSERNANIIFDLELAYIKSLYDNGLVSEDDYVFMPDNALAKKVIEPLKTLTTLPNN